MESLNTHQYIIMRMAIVISEYEEQIERLMRADRDLTHQEEILLDYCNFMVQSFNKNI